MPEGKRCVGPTRASHAASHRPRHRSSHGCRLDASSTRATAGVRRLVVACYAMLCYAMRRLVGLLTDLYSELGLEDVRKVSGF